MHRIIEAADELGMVVIVSCFYGHQVRFLRDDIAVMAGIHQKPPVLLRAVRIFTVGQFPVDQKFCVTDLKL